MKDITTLYKQARRVATPLIAVSTPDPAATVLMLAKCESDTTPVVKWDCVNGFSAVNTAGVNEVAKAQPNDTALKAPDFALQMAQRFGEDTVCFFFGMIAISNLPEMNGLIIQQGIWNLRDPFKANGRTAVLLGSHAKLPSLLEGDVLVIDEPLPDAESLEQIVLSSIEAMQQARADYPLPDAQGITRAVDALRGLSAYPAEQATALSLKKQGLDIDALWDRKRERIRQTPGLEVYSGQERYSDIGGCDRVKTFLSRLVNGPDSPRAVVFIDEIEKAVAGSTGDTSGVSQEMHGTLLRWMQDKEALGVLFIGPPGAAKSAVAKSTGNEAGLLTISFDLSAMKGSLVGESNANLSRALKVVDAVSDGRALVIATCNSVNNLSPELRRRFQFGTFFFDLPTEEERAKIWEIYRERFGLGESEKSFDDTGWTGAEIRQCCNFAWRLETTLDDASDYIVPVSVSAGAQIEQLRRESSGRYLSASQAGVYEYKAVRRGASREYERKRISGAESARSQNSAV